MPNSWFNPHRHQFAAASASAVTDAFSRNQVALIADGLVSSQMRSLPLEVLESAGYWRIGVVGGVIQALEEGLEVEAGARVLRQAQILVYRRVDENNFEAWLSACNCLVGCLSTASFFGGRVCLFYGLDLVRVVKVVVL